MTMMTIRESQFDGYRRQAHPVAGHMGVMQLHRMYVRHGVLDIARHGLHPPRAAPLALERSNPPCRLN